jgi:hypothetical protein
MKKFIVSVVAAGALAAGGAASAQDILGGLGSVLPQILGNIGLGGITQQYGYPEGTTYESGGRYVYVEPGTGRHVVLDQYGTYIDQYGRRVSRGGGIVNQQSSVVTPYGSPPDGRDTGGWVVNVGPDGRPIYTDQNGHPIAGAPRPPTSAEVSQNNLDRDGDGVLNIFDRYPDDSRYR